MHLVHGQVMMMAKIKAMRVDCSSCNGCDIEILASLVTKYNLSSLDIEVTYDPSEANALVVVGGVNHKTAPELKKIYEIMAEPRIVVAMGTCALTKCVFQKGYSMVGPVDEIIPVSSYVFGCPPRPQGLVLALASALGIELDMNDEFWDAPEGFRGKMKHSEEKCLGCGACVNMCPSFAIRLREDANRKNLIFDLAKCTYCGTCADICPADAIEMTRDYRLIYDDRKLGQLHGCMAREMCGTCHRYWQTEAQHEFIMERLVEKWHPGGSVDKIRSRHPGGEASPGFLLEKAEQSLGTCGLCKHHSDYLRRVKKEMSVWAMNGGGA